MSQRVVSAMIINKIRFENYRVYYGEVVFEFPVENEKNISVIFADNDVGKTSFFMGVLFCLYGEKDVSSLQDMININAQMEGSNSAVVSIFAEQDNCQIEITRVIGLRGAVTGRPKKTDFKTTLTVIKDGVPLTNDNDEKADFINSLIHQDASQYFFFDGEKINDYSTANVSQYKEAISRILGIKEIDNAIEDLEIIQRDFERERDAWIKKQNKYEDILQQKLTASEKVKQLSELLDKYNSEISAADSRIRQIEESLKEFEQNQERIEKKQKLELSIKHLEEESKAATLQRDECIRKNATCILGAIAYKRFTKDEVFQPAEYHISSSVKDHLLTLIQQPQCVCGATMDEGRVNAIMRYIDENFITADDLQLQNERNRLFHNVRKYCNHGEDSRKLIEELNLRILEYAPQIASAKLELAKIKRDIGSFSEEASERLAQDLTRTENKRDESLQRKGSTELLLSQAKETLSEFESRLAELSFSDEEGSFCQNKLNVTTNLITLFSQYREQLLEEKRKDVQNNATAVFRAITNAPQKYKGIIIDENYNLLLELTDGETYRIEPGRVLNPSTGQSKVISLSYISGLNQSSDFAAPIIIDNPLGLFSDEHRTAIANYLPRFGKQVIFMVSTGDLSDKYRDILRPFIKSEYYLENTSDDTWPKTTIACKEVF